MAGHNLDTVTRLRRMRNVLLALDRLDLDAADLRDQIETLRKRATLALQETKLTRGNPINLAEARKKARISHRRKGRVTADRIMPVVKALRAEGIKTYAALADELNKRGVRPPTASTWSASTVYAVANRDDRHGTP